MKPFALIFLLPCLAGAQKEDIGYYRSFSVARHIVVVPTVMSRQQAEKKADLLTLLDYRITGLWVENQRLSARIDSLEAKLARAHIGYRPGLNTWNDSIPYISFDPEGK